MFDRREPLERHIQLEALSRIVDDITGEVFDRTVEGDWSRNDQVEAEAADEPESLAAVRVDLIAAHMCVELSTASAWFAEKARLYADRANEQIVQEVARST